jgi:hypothetical protein
MARERRTRPCKAPRFRRPITAGRRSDGVAVSHAWPPPCPAVPPRSPPSPLNAKTKALRSSLLHSKLALSQFLLNFTPGKVFQNKELAESLLVLLHNKLAMLLVLWHNKDIELGRCDVCFCRRFS